MEQKYKEEGGKIIWLFAIAVAVIGVAVLASIFIDSKNEMQKIAAPEKAQQYIRPTSQQPIQQKNDRPKLKAAEEPTYRREIRRTGGQSKETCLAQSNGTFDNSYVQCREGYSKEVWVRTN